jgi:hypothetical protein
MAALHRGIAQLRRLGQPELPMLYFHPWEFDVEQRRLPLSLLARWRTYVGIGRSKPRLLCLLNAYRFCRAIDAVRCLQAQVDSLPVHRLADQRSGIQEYHPCAEQ